MKRIKKAKKTQEIPQPNSVSFVLIKGKRNNSYKKRFLATGRRIHGFFKQLGIPSVYELHRSFWLSNEKDLSWMAEEFKKKSLRYLASLHPDKGENSTIQDFILFNVFRKRVLAHFKRMGYYESWR